MINANDWSSSRALPQQYTFHTEIQIQTLTQIHYTSTPASAGAAHFGPHWFTLFYYSVVSFTHCTLFASLNTIFSSKQYSLAWCTSSYLEALPGVLHHYNHTNKITHMPSKTHSKHHNESFLTSPSCSAKYELSAYVESLCISFNQKLPCFPMASRRFHMQF